ncbi:MarR family transcriptional regulator [Roseiarcaceae bacterium H3SJ34-1]|uniref:MarR family winged helix-turn-helix transcriptional regulator n=1 Tax=Terripilifer ovatus TaxID=3032367 RepID=UPI003AB99F2C|nr:MarR family transcriptional regulator [Roseiarcaceae bacterium H3SJ34-1]
MNAPTNIPTKAPTLGFLLHDVARLLRRRFEQHTKDCGLTRSQWHVLAYLAQNEGINQTGLAELLDIEPITVGRLVDKLQAMGLIERRPDPSDRRVWLLYSTPAAAPQLDHLRELGDLTRGEALADISDTERDQLVALLQALKINLTEACDRPAAAKKRTSQARTGEDRTHQERADLERVENV